MEQVRTERAVAVPLSDSLCDQFARVRDAPGATLGRTLLG